MEWKAAEIEKSGAAKIPREWLHLYYYESLNVLFRFENALRVFVYIVLKSKLGKDWDSAALGDGITIRSETRKRITQARDHGYLGYEVTSPMLYLNSGELTQLITSEAYWKHFAPYFKASKSIILTKLQEIGTIRNSLAHFRPLKHDDIDLLKQNSKHVLLEIEKCLVQITAITDLVPTNSEDVWYKLIKPLGSSSSNTSIYISKDQHWVRIELSYKIPALQTRIWSTHGSLQVGNLRTPQILKNYSAIRQNCIYVSEASIWGALNSEKQLSAQKKVSVVFSKETLDRIAEDVSTEFRDLFVQIEAEGELLNQDNLARGTFIETRSINASLREWEKTKYWKLDFTALKTSEEEIDEVEFWGIRDQHEQDFISSTSRYPWMPSSVSTDDIPF